MDKEQEELKFLGFFGILKESFKIIWSWRKIFTQITIALILPLSFIFLAEIHIFLILLDKTLKNTYSKSSFGYANFPTYSNSSGYANFPTYSKSTGFWLFQVASFILLTIFTLLSTVAVVYTVSCKYTAKEISFKKLPTVLPKVWKRFLVTFLWSFFIVFGYSVVGVLVILACLAFTRASILVEIVILVVLVILFGNWQLANVVSVLEDVSGIKALRKSNALIKGKMGIAVAISLLLGICILVIVAHEILVMVGFLELGIGIRIGVGILCSLFLVYVILFGIVAQTVLYFVCKSHHHENIGAPLDPPVIKLGESHV